MSVSYYVYVGPYVEINNPVQDTETKYHSCSNSKCQMRKKEMSSQFCPHCGAKVTLQSFPTKKRSDMYDACEKVGIDENLFFRAPMEGISDKLFLTCNQKLLPRETNFASWEEGVTEMEDIDVAKEKAAFDDIYHKDMELLREFFGRDNVIVKWGVLQYAY